MKRFSISGIASLIAVSMSARSGIRRNPGQELIVRHELDVRQLPEDTVADILHLLRRDPDRDRLPDRDASLDEGTQLVGMPHVDEGRASLDATDVIERSLGQIALGVGVRIATAETFDHRGPVHSDVVARPY